MDCKKPHWLITGEGGKYQSKSKAKKNAANTAAGSRFTKALAFVGKRPIDVANALGVEPQHVNNWKSRGVSKSKNNQIAEFLGVNPGWLATGYGKMIDDPPQHRSTFSSRLNELCDEAGLPPPSVRILVTPRL